MPCLRLLFIFIAAIPAVVWGTSPTSGRVPCGREHYARKFVELNINATQVPEAYGQINDRTWFDYEEAFVFGPHEIAAARTVVDGGAGLGLAGMQFAIAHPRARVIAINAQDQLGWVERMVTAEALALEVRPGEPANTRLNSVPWMLAIDRINQVKTLSLYKLLHALNVSVPERWEGLVRQKGLVGALRTFVSEMTERLAELRASGRFRYVPGFVEEALANRTGIADLVFDYFGAFFYSPDRLGILERYYGALTSGGRAHVFTNHHLEDQVELRPGVRIDLVDYLVMNKPEIFRTVPTVRGTDLQIRRSPQVTRLKIPLEIIESELVGDAATGYRYWRHVYRKRVESE